LLNFISFFLMMNIHNNSFFVCLFFIKLI